MKECTSQEIFSKTFTFWDKLTEDMKKLLCSNTVRKTFEKGQNIHGASGVCTGGILVIGGCIRVYLLSESGKEVTLYRLYPGELCMLSASCVIKTITFDVFVDAEEKTECLIVSGNAFAKVTQSCIYAENFALNLAVERFSDVIWAMQQILFMSFDKRLAIFLLDETSKNGTDDLKLTQEQIAKYTCSAREVVSRMLKYFESEGIVEHFRGGIRISDREKLKKIALN